MNYINNLNHSFSSHALEHILGFYIGADDDLIYDAGNYSGLSSLKDVVRGVNNTHYSDIIFVPIDNNSGVFVFGPRVSFAQFTLSSYQIEFELMVFSDVDDVVSVDNVEFVDEYVLDGNYNSYGELEYGAFESNLSLGNQSFIFDLEQTKYNFNDYLYQNYFSLVEGKPSWQDLYNNYGLYVSGYEIYNINLSLSIGIDQKGVNAYDSAYQSGYGNGYYNGYQSGFNDGQATNIDGETAQAFDYISQSFSALSQILEIQVLPHITLGLAFSIPFTLVLIITIFKLIKK